MAVANQKTVGINKEVCDKSHPYAMINVNALNAAMLDLKPTELKLWLYFAKNRNTYQFELSSVAVQNFCGISEKSYRDAVKALVAKRYLVQKSGNHYDFYEIPLPVEQIEVPKDGTIITCHTSTETAEFSF